MTNSSLRFALKALPFAIAAALISGCGVNPEKEYAKGTKAFSDRDFKIASQSFRAVVKECPENVDALVMLARSEFAHGMVSSALEALNAAAASNGADSDIIELFAQIAFFTNDYASSEKHYLRLACDASRPKEVRAIGWAGLGVLDFKKIGQKADAASICRDSARVKFLKAIDLDPRNTSARYHLARLYRDSFNYLDMAKEQFEMFAYLEKDDAEKIRKVRDEIIPSLKAEIANRAASLPGVSRKDPVACAEFLKKADLQYAKDYKKAKVMYSEAFRRDPTSVAAAMGIIKTLHRQGASKSDLEEALEVYKKACSISPSSIKLLVATGDLAVSLGKSALAVELYSRALALTPSSKDIVRKLVNSLSKSGNRSLAAVYSGYLEFLSGK